MDLLREHVPQIEGVKITKLARHTLNPQKHTPALMGYVRGPVGNLEAWQRIQRNPVFHPCKFVIGLSDVENRGTRLVGVYEKIEETPEPVGVNCLVSEHGIPRQLVNALRSRDDRYCYVLDKIFDADDLAHPVIVKWANPGKKPSRYGFQWAHNHPKEIISPPVAP